jgi:SAM-dependent methyltransferase
VRHNYFDDPVALSYDADSAEMFADAVVTPAIDVLAELAGGGPALEFGIGTGRLAIPLHQRGVPVHGIDLSEAMIAQLQAKPAGSGIDVTIGDFASARVPGSYRLAYLVFNTIGNLTTQEDQVACFANAAAHLEPGGHFVVELLVPALRRLPPGDTVRAFSVTPSYLGFDEYDFASQGLVSHHCWPDEGRAVSMPFRYAWPAELDLMARLAGMTLAHRWADWDRAPFTSNSDKHVSVWQKPPS